jgi:hypothetical protein
MILLLDFLQSLNFLKTHYVSEINSSSGETVLLVCWVLVFKLKNIYFSKTISDLTSHLMRMILVLVYVIPQKHVLEECI